MRLGWDMAWDLFWFRTFAKCHNEWFDWVIKLTYVDILHKFPDNDNRRLS